MKIRRTTRWTFAAIASAALLAPATTAFGCLCPENIDGDNQTGVNDLLVLLGEWGPRGGLGPADFDSSGDVGVPDLLTLLEAWGPCQLDYPPQDADAEAYQIALEMLGADGPLFPDDAIVDRVEQDLNAIRDAVPDLQSQLHTMAWAPNQMIVKVMDEPEPDALAQYECYNAYHGVTDSEFMFGFGGFSYYLLTLEGKVNVPALAQTYTDQLDMVDFAEPNGLIGGQNFWTPTILEDGIWSWNIDDGFHDCFDGCDCHTVYTIQTTPRGEVDILNVDQFGQPWCDF